MDSVYVIGVGMIRFNKYPDKTVQSMAHEAIELVLKDAGLTREDLEAVFFSNTFWGMFDNQHSIRGEVVMRNMGVGNIPITNVENACAGGSTALHLAYTGIRAGMYDVALAIGSEKITNPNKALSLGAYATCMDVGNFAKHIENIMELSKTLTIKIPEDQSAPGEGRSIFMDAYAMGAQQQLAVICAKNHFHGSLNPLSQYQQVMTAEEVLAAKAVAYPLTRPMCAPVGDGAAATIVCSEKFLKKLTNVRPVRIRASILGTGADRVIAGGPTRASSVLPISVSVWRKRPTWRQALALKTSILQKFTMPRRGGNSIRLNPWDSVLWARVDLLRNRVQQNWEVKCLLIPVADWNAKGIPLAPLDFLRFMSWSHNSGEKPENVKLKVQGWPWRKTAGVISVSRKRPWAFTYWKRFE